MEVCDLGVLFWFMYAFFMALLSATYLLVCDYEFHHVTYRHILHEELTLAGQGWLVVDLCCKQKKKKGYSKTLHLGPLVKHCALTQIHNLFESRRKK